MLNHTNNGDFELLFGETDNSFLGWVHPRDKNMLSNLGSCGKASATEIELTDGILLVNKDVLKKIISIN